jgi:hypothetical protein
MGTSSGVASHNMPSLQRPRLEMARGSSEPRGKRENVGFGG